MRLTLVRHGQSVANAEGRLQGQMDFPLSQKGMWEAEQLGDWLKEEPVDALYSSDLSRAYQTAVKINKHHQLEIKQWKELREVHLGRFQGYTQEEMAARFPEYIHTDLFTCGLEDVEQIEQLQQRARQVLQRLLATHFREHVLAVSHGAWIGALLQALFKLEWRGKRAFVLNNTSLTTIDFSDPKQFVVVGVNETPHLTQLRKKDISQHVI